MQDKARTRSEAKLLDGAGSSSRYTKVEMRCERCDRIEIVTVRKKSKQCSKCNKTVRRKRRLLRIRTGAPVEDIPIKELSERFNHQCAMCSVIVKRDNSWPDGWTTDHVIPLAKGGKHRWDNVQLLCRRCNSHKQDDIAG